jgi:putative glycosyltransferase (TIGR04372 family)
MLADLGDSDRAASLVPVMFEVEPRASHVYQYAAVNCFLSGEYRIAEQIWDRLDEHRLRALKNVDVSADAVPVLGRSWLLAIGHIAHLDIYLKDRILRGLGSHRPKMMVPHGVGIPNRELLGMWERYIDVAYDANPLLEYDSSSELLGEEFWTVRVNGRTEMYCRAGTLIDRAWTAAKRGPLLELSTEQKEYAWKVLERLGIPRESWFACLHVREPGFHIAWHSKKPGIRDARIETYELAAEQVINRGGYVVRVGDSSMAPLPPRAKTIDYAHSEEKNETMDVLLCAMCRLFIGTNSGLSLVPPVFGVPCALTNWAPIAIPQWYSADLYIPKLIFSRESKRFLSFDEMFRGHAGWKQFSTFFDEARLEVVDNTAEDIAEFVAEVLDTQDGREKWNSADHARRTRLETLAVDAGSYIGARMGRRFMDKYSYLI